MSPEEVLFNRNPACFRSTVSDVGFRVQALVAEFISPKKYTLSVL